MLRPYLFSNYGFLFFQMQSELDRSITKELNNGERCDTREMTKAHWHCLL